MSFTKTGAGSCETIAVGKEITFAIHDEIHTISASNGITPQTSLNTYLRNYANLHGTKGMCYEGGCGACVCAVSFKHPITKRERTFAVNSCLISILSCHGWNISTVEGIGNRLNGYHVIQKSLAQHSGTQCGYCSGGMVMNMYALYEENEVLTQKDIEDSFGGSLCRCTGYRPIMDAFKSLATDADPKLIDKYPDIEDIKICTKTGTKCNKTCQLKLEDKPIRLIFDDTNWYKVFSIAEILEIFELIGNSSYRFVAGNTGKGVYKIINNPDYYIDVQSVKELTSHSMNENVNIGGGVSLTETMAILEKTATENQNNFWYFQKMYTHLDLVANVPVRNVGTIAGNLSLKHDHNEFPSDVFLLLETCKATLTIVDKTGNEMAKTIPEYLKMDMNKCIIKSVTLYPLNKDNYLFESYKICPRVQNAHAYVNAGFLVEHDGNYVVKTARIVYGGINPKFIHAEKTENFLKGKSLLDTNTLQGACAQLDVEIKPDYVLPDASPKFRKNLAISLFYKFVLHSIPKDKINMKYQSGGLRLVRGVSSGCQFYQTNKNLYPLTEPIPKLEALQQCSGEAPYVYDMPAIPGELFGCLVLSTAKPLTTIKNIVQSEALNMPGVVSFITHKDIPGKNSFTPAPLAPTVEQLFCVNKVLYNAQPIGVILASTQEQACEAAKKVKVIYESSKEIPALNIKDVLTKKLDSRITNVVQIEPKTKGKNIKNIIQSHFEVDGQYHFTMETQCCICIPAENGCFDLYSATQWMNIVQMSVAQALDIPMNKINIVVRRLGGAYGAKIVRSSLVATACAIASNKVNKPVRLIMSLNDNMECIGKRVPTLSNYEIGVDENGVIQYLDNTYYQDNGLSGENESVVAHIPYYMTTNYVNDTWKFNGNRVQTDMPGNCYCRAPGACEGIGMIESMMEHISHKVKKDPVDVRLANLKPGQTDMVNLINELKTWANYDDEKKEVEIFNKSNNWMKKGISLVCMNYPFAIFGPYSCLVSIYAGDGTVAIAHGGVECGQGINTKVAQACAYILGIPLDMICIKASNNLCTPNNQATGGSITSEAVCYATIKACKEILKRLEPVKAKMDNPTWKELVQAGYNENIELCATHMYSTASEVESYNIYGVCMAKVEVDCLTGEHNIVKVHLIEDCGQSMSPEIDVGQIEGAFMMGMGYYTTEKLIYDENGQLLTNSTWTYKVPGVKDIPEDFQVKFKQNSTNPVGVLNSKATAEPPLCMTVAVPLAIRRAMASARLQADPSAESFVPIDGPTTVEYTYLNCLNDYKQYSL